MDRYCAECFSSDIYHCVCEIEQAHARGRREALQAVKAVIRAPRRRQLLGEESMADRLIVVENFVDDELAK